MDQISHGDANEIATWEEMTEALLTHFSPQHERWDAHMKIKYINQNGSLQAYQDEFDSVILELPDMAEKEKVFNFIIS